MNEVEFILYVNNQEESKQFYKNLLNILPSVDVPGMTEFILKSGVKLGLMPENSIAKILKDKTAHPSIAHGIPRCELYLVVKSAEDYINKGVQLGGKLISEFKIRDWGDKVGYITDIDGHVVAFAERI